MTIGHNVKRLGAVVIADMLAGYGVTHVFMVPAVLRRTFAEMEKQKGRQFDPECASGFLTIRQRVILEMQSETKQLSGATLHTLRVAT